MNYTNEVDWHSIATHISQVSGQAFQIQTAYPVTGGCVNEAYRIEGMGKNYFVKLNKASHLEMFAAEAAGLAELAQPAVIRVPFPQCWGSTGEHAYLVMEYLALRGDTEHSTVALAQQLAVMHQVSKFPFGWYRNNYIGSNLQDNAVESDWVKFWRRHRLGFQLELAAQNGYTGKLQSLGDELLQDFGLFFTSYTPYPSLLHGDLWSGNYGIDIQGQPIIFDPAVYYGDREVDIAMTELFGGFPAQFYEAYQECWPLDAGYPTRKVLYNLYHILNHLNLFGGSYLAQSERMIAWLLSELKA